MVHQLQVFHHIVHDLLYIQNGTICVQRCLYFVCTLIFLHSPFSPSTFAAQLTCTSRHFITMMLYTHFSHQNMNFGSRTMWKNGVLLPTYPTFVVDVSTSLFIVCSALCICVVINFACCVFNHFFYHAPFLCPLIYYKLPLFACNFTLNAHIHALLCRLHDYSCTQVAQKSYDVGLLLTIHNHIITTCTTTSLLLYDYYFITTSTTTTTTTSLLLPYYYMTTTLLLLHYYYLSTTLLLLLQRHHYYLYNTSLYFITTTTTTSVLVLQPHQFFITINLVLHYYYYYDISITTLLFHYYKLSNTSLILTYYY
ncbi:hypothetical protein PFBG_05997 [Plasmodium falciparum 7G8]|uniref:Uncharacterized protein n=1 Tax=Plasmodium falciparum (isolate 7G8) TaxID=57266 RepID=W7F5Z3_PLAF8|nr:hypothetical protein PFBG_05997 [Plasmodium falciparum 7G8]